MTKVFRLHRGGEDTIGHWEDSSKIESRAIDTILDTVEATNKKEITSIPSPFARMDLAKRAFKYVVDHGLDGNTAYHKIVSDCLDVGQIFFNIEKYRDFIEIIVWDKRNQLDELLYSEITEHQRLGQTYNTYIKQDGEGYNFNEMDCIYLLNYTDPTGPAVMNIIGATSPSTLFFSSANDLSYVRGKIRFGSDLPFDEDYRPLYEREFEYIKYIYSLRSSIKGFANIFKEVNQYLDDCFRRLPNDQKREISQLISGHYGETYDDITVAPTAQQYVMILDNRLKRKRTTNMIDSGFEMLVSNPQKHIGSKIPLALPIDTYTEPTIYVLDKWDKNTIVPKYLSTPIMDRTLPDDGTKYPFVIISDFLEDNLVRIPYKMNSDGFFDGHMILDNKGSKCSYLLPLKQTFFDYFDTKTLKEKVSHKNIFEMQQLIGGVKVILRIPIKAGGYVQYERIYFSNIVPDLVGNKGAIIEREFTLGQFPGLKYPSNVTPYYRVAILDRDSVSGENNPYSLSFFNNNNDEVSYDSTIKRNSNPDGARISKIIVDTITYSLSQDYDYIRIAGGDISAVVVPHFSEKTSSRKFRFAIDFGTTNTHIEYSVEDNPSEAFNITENDIQIQKLHITHDPDLKNVFNSDFIPDIIGGDSVFRYPMRTVISEGQNTNWNQAVYVMANTNIPYTYEKNLPFTYNTLHTNLKWSTVFPQPLRAEKYIENLMILLRNKVLLNQGDLSKTEIVWFYPASMTQGRFNRFKSVWDKCFKDLFNAPESNIAALSESVAPYYYYKATNGAVSNVVSVDIGGGTTDVLIVREGNPEYLTSFRYAANNIFGDGYSYNSDTNGYVNKYVPEILKKLEDCGFPSLKEVLNSVKNKKASTDIIAFFFSLASNKEILKKNCRIDFGQMLADDNRGKYIVIIFYVAIMYHIATIMKAKGLTMPRHIAFSGNGSKVLNILSENNNTLERFTKLIFEKVYDKKYPEDGLDIIRPSQPKESTCKGGILITPLQSQAYSQLSAMKSILLGIDDHTFLEHNIKYSEVTDEIKEQVISYTKRFIDFAFDLDNDFNYYAEFDVDITIMSKAKALCFRDLRTFLDNGIKLKEDALQKDGASDIIEETLFFYPLTGILNALVRGIYNL